MSLFLIPGTFSHEYLHHDLPNLYRFDEAQNDKYLFIVLMHCNMKIEHSISIMHVNLELVIPYHTQLVAEDWEEKYTEIYVF